MAASEPRSYSMTAWDARNKLLNARFARGAIAGYPDHDVYVSEVQRGKPEWQVITQQRDGFWCPIKLSSPDGEEAPNVIVSVDCPAEATPEARAALEAATDALLTNQTPELAR